MGFTVAEGPEVETDWYNFQALNIPDSHPARSMWDTLYVDLGPPESTVLRTHTSPVQIRVMEGGPPPIYSIMPGRVYRRDTADASHMPVPDRGSSTASASPTSPARSKPSPPPLRGRHPLPVAPLAFLFTEPSAEYDINCIFCEGVVAAPASRPAGSSRRLRHGNPNVFAAGARPRGVERFRLRLRHRPPGAMRHQVDAIREIYTNDVRFLEQF
jgi:phenylalanyl-tRNA synthetase alpha chain